MAVVLLAGSAHAETCQDYNISVLGAVQYFNTASQLVATGFIVKNTGTVAIPLSNFKIEVDDTSGKMLATTEGYAYFDVIKFPGVKWRTGPAKMLVVRDAYTKENGDGILEPGEEATLVYGFQDPRGNGARLKINVFWNNGGCETNTPTPIGYGQDITVNGGPAERVILWKSGGTAKATVASIVELRQIYVITNEKHQPAAVGAYIVKNGPQTMDIPLQSVQITVEYGKKMELQWNEEHLTEMVDATTNKAELGKIYPVLDRSPSIPKNGVISTGTAFRAAARMPDDFKTVTSFSVKMRVDLSELNDGIFKYGSIEMSGTAKVPSGMPGNAVYEVWPEMQLTETSASRIMDIDAIHVVTDSTGRINKIIVFVRNKGDYAFDPHDIMIVVKKDRNHKNILLGRFEGDSLQVMPYNQFAQKATEGIYFLTSYATNGVTIAPEHVGAIGVVLGTERSVDEGDELGVYVYFPYTAEAGAFADIPELEPNAEYAVFPEVRKVAEVKPLQYSVAIESVQGFGSQGQVDRIIVTLRNTGSETIDLKDLEFEIQTMNGKTYEAFDGKNMGNVTEGMFQALAPGEIAAIGINKDWEFLKAGQIEKIGMVLRNKIPEDTPVKISVSGPYVPKTSYVGEISLAPPVVPPVPVPIRHRELKVHVSARMDGRETRRIPEGAPFEICVNAEDTNEKIHAVGYTLFKEGKNFGIAAKDIKYVPEGASVFSCFDIKGMEAGTYTIKGFAKTSDGKTASDTEHISIYGSQPATPAAKTQKIAAIMNRIAQRFDRIAKVLQRMSDRFESVGMEKKSLCYQEAAMIASSESQYVSTKATEISESGQVNRNDIISVIRDILSATVQLKNKIRECAGVKG